MRTLILRCGLAALAVLVMIVSEPAHAQAPTAAITGVVRDSVGVPITGALLQARNTRTGFSYSTISGTEGRYWLRGLAPGAYTVSAGGLGLAEATREAVLPVGSTSTADFRLTVRPEVIEGITVRIAESTQSDVSFSLSPAEIAAVPLESRDFVELASIAPGATSAMPSPAAVAQTSIGALNSYSLGIQVDGGNFTVAALNEQPGTLPLLAIQEFEVLTTAYSAEHGQSASGMVNAVTRTGGNELDAEAFTLYRSRSLNARGAFETAKPDYNRVHMGAAVGFPIVQDATHGFVAVERRVENLFKTVNTNGSLPSLEGTFRTPSEQHLLFARVDHRPSDRDEFMVRVAGDLSSRDTDVGATQNCATWGGQVGADDFRLNIERTLLSGLASYRRRTRDRGLAESRVHVMRFVPNHRRLTEAPAFARPSACSGGNPNAFEGGNWRVELDQDFSWTANALGGTHRLKVGASAAWVKVRGDLRTLTNGLFQFGADADPLPFVLVRHLGTDVGERSTWQLAAYVQDEWSVSDQLTLQLGVRYDIEPGIAEHGMSPSVLTALPFLTGDPRPTDKNNVSPRIGFAWTPDGRGETVLRGGVGIFYNQYLLWPSASESRQTQRELVFGPGTLDPSTIPPDPNTPAAAYPGGNDRPAPFTRQLSLGLERALPGDLVVRIDGLVVQGRNQPVARELQTWGSPRRYPQHSIVWQLLNHGEAEARMLTLRAEKISSRARIGVHYTLADRKTATDRWDLLVPQTDPTNERFDDEMGPAAWDERHRVVALASVAAPGAVGAFVKGVYSSARPYTALTGSDDNQDFVLNDRPTGEGRNARRGPDFFSVDLGLTRAISLGSTTAVLVANVYNVFNRTNLLSTSVVGDLTSPSFGQALDAWPKRQVELGLQLRHGGPS